MNASGRVGHNPVAAIAFGPIKRLIGPFDQGGGALSASQGGNSD